MNAPTSAPPAVSAPAAAMVMLASLAQQVADAAKAAAARGGRPCRLTDARVVLAILEALMRGTSHTYAAKRAGITEGALRLWLKQAAEGHAPYQPLLRAVRHIEILRAMPRPEVVPTVAKTPAAPQPPSLPLVGPVYIARWRNLQLRLDQLRKSHSTLAQYDATGIEHQLREEMTHHGLREMDLARFPRPYRLNLPRNLRFDDVQQRYVRWCEAVGLPGPTDQTLEPLAREWHREHCAPLERTAERT